MSPDDFAAHMREGIASDGLAFTATADAESVIGQYPTGFAAAYEWHTHIQRNCPLIHMNNIAWGPDEGRTIARAIAYVEEHCSPLERLNLNFTITLTAMQALPSRRRLASTSPS